MSHFSTVKTKLASKRHLMEALSDLGYACLEGSVEITGYQGNRNRVDIRVPGRNGDYDMGFRWEDDAFALVADWWGIKNTSQVTFLPLVTQRYSYRIVLEQMCKDQGFTIVQEENLSDRTIHLSLRRMA